MSNEELVTVIQAGEDRMAELWAQVEGLVKWKARRIMTALEGMGRGVEFEDLHQTGYLALVEAVGTYDPAAGAVFSTWFMNYLKTAFADATGYRTKAGRLEPINNALSLDTPLSDAPDSDTMMEVTPDPEGQHPIQSVEDAVFQQQLHEALEAALDAMPEQYGDVLRLRYYEGQTFAEVAQSQGITPEQARQTEGKAIRELRRPRNAKTLHPFYNFDFYYGTSLGAFRYTGMSVQERYLMAKEGR